MSQEPIQVVNLPNNPKYTEQIHNFLRQAPGNNPQLIAQLRFKYVITMKVLSESEFQKIVASVPRPTKGLGDVVAYVAKVTGISAIVKYMSKKTGVPCGCGARQEALNRAVPLPKVITGWIPPTIEER